MLRIAIILPAILLGASAVAKDQQPAIDPWVMEWVDELAPKIMEILQREAPAKATVPEAVPILPGSRAEPMPIWECRDIVRSNPDWPRHPEMVAFMRKCGVFPPRGR